MTNTNEATQTYMRDKVPAKNMGQCPCCLRSQRSTARGTMTRHGWTETGRQVGQHGCGYQWGNCRGGSMRPLQQTDADALVILAELADRIARLDAELVTHRDLGADTYSTEWLVQVYSFDSADYLRCLQDLGLTVEEHATKIRKEGYRVSYSPAKRFVFTVARGAAEVAIRGRDVKPGGLSYDSALFTVGSYDALRAHHVSELEGVKRSLVAQVAAIKAAIKEHRENPSNGSPDTVKRGPVTHYLRRWEVRDHRQSGVVMVKREAVACGSRGYSVRKSENETEVTCSRCKKHLPKAAK